ncbi:DUF488 domain-containing protein [Streptomyces sp. NPDC087850]|uniref:DUF488 domain-containing protein n=1 Tax=unclassified Streptomyces TaxID=2593676 RepID=UPI0038118608
MSAFTVQRVYDDTPGPRAPADAARVLVDRLWPRGVSKERAGLDVWLKDIAPSAELRSWYHQDTSRYAEFASRYGRELDDAAHRPAVDGLLDLVRERPVTLVTAVRDVEHSHLPTLLRHLDGGRT